MFSAKYLLPATLVCIAVLNLHAAEKSWTEVRSAHFTVVTDLSEKRGVEVARHCEQMRSAFTLLMNRATTHDPAPLLILALNGHKEVDELGGTLRRQAKHVGLFLPGSDESFMLVDASGDPGHVLFHEYAHELLSANTTSAVQTWFDEGFAEYFSTLEANAKATRLGLVPAGELEFLRKNGKLMRLEDLAAVRQDSPVYNQDGPAQALFYAESWLLVHYLFDHQLISHAEPFFRMIASGSSLADATKEAFGMSPAHLEDELMDYAKGERFRYFLLPSVENAPNGETRTAPLSAVTARALQAELRWHSQARHSKADAERHATESRELLALEPQNPLALRNLGIARLEAGEKEEAIQALKAALRGDPNEVLTHYALALALSSEQSDATGTAEHGVLLQGELATCIKLDPTFADAYRLQASEFFRRGLLDAAANAMHEAISLSPRSEEYKLVLADIELKKRDYLPAIALLQELKNSHNADISRRAEYYLSSEVAEDQNGKE